MRNRFKNTLYTVEDLKYLNGRWQYVRSEDGTLFSGPYRTKIKPEDLPEWYVYGRYYKRFGYMSTKGITDLLYIPNRFSNRWFASVQPYLETSDGQHNLTMCHFPMVTWNHQSRSYMIHGHTHENTDIDYWPLLGTRERVLNAGCDINNFEPVSFQELVENNAKFKAMHSTCSTERHT